MQEFWNKTKEQIVLYKIAVIYGVLFSVNSICMSIIGALAGGAQWSAMNGQSKFLVIISVLASWTAVMMAFLNKAVSRLQQGKNPISDGQTEFTKNPRRDYQEGTVNWKQRDEVKPNENKP